MLRILSDLHLFEASSRVRELTRLRSLLVGVDHLVLNGDTRDLEHGVTPAQEAELRAFFAAAVPQVTYLTGNHDPDGSSHDELLLAADRLWVTHGDILFPDSTPWSRVQPVLVARLAAARAAHPPAAWDHLPTRLRLYREACRRASFGCDLNARTPGAAFRRALHTFFPPRQLSAILRAWRTAPHLARTLATRHRPTAQIIVNGHLHYPFIARRPGAPTVINTGSFSRPFGGQCVDLIHDTTVLVRRIIERADGFHPGPPRAEIPLAATPPARLTSPS